MPIYSMSFTQKPKKEAQKAPNKPLKSYFTVKVQATVPVELSYRVLAESPDQAIELITKQPFKDQNFAPLYSWQRIKLELIKVFKDSTSILLKLKEMR